MAIGAEAQVDCAAAIVEVAQVHRVEKTVRPIRGDIGEESELLSEAAAESRSHIAGAKVAKTGANGAVDILINSGFWLNDNDSGVTTAEFSWNVTCDHLHHIDRVGVE